MMIAENTETMVESTAGIAEIALGVSILSLVIASISLFWRYQSWKLDGWRLTVKATTSIISNHPGVFLTVSATNVGRMPVEVDSIGFVLTDGRQAVILPHQGLSHPLPTVIEPARTARWLVSWDDLKALKLKHVSVEAAGETITSKSIPNRPT